MTTSRKAAALQPLAKEPSDRTSHSILGSGSFKVQQSAAQRGRASAPPALTDRGGRVRGPGHVSNGAWHRTTGVSQPRAGCPG